MKEQPASSAKNKEHLLERLIEENIQLVHWLDHLSFQAQKLLASNRWKVGSMVGTIWQKVRRKPHTTLPSDHILHWLKEYLDWRLQYQKPGLETNNGLATDANSLIADESAPDHRQDKELDYALRRLREEPVVFVLKRLGRSGGPAVVHELAKYLRANRVQVRIALEEIDHPTTLDGVELVGLDSPRVQQAGTAVATSWQTIDLVNTLYKNHGFSGRRVLFCQSDEPAWWPPEKKGHPNFPGKQWHESALKAFRSPGYKHIIIADHMRAFADKYGFDIVGKVRVATPRQVHLECKPKEKPSGVIGFVNRGAGAWYKGREDCLNAVELIRESMPEVRVLSMGFEPPDRNLSKLDIRYIHNPTDRQVSDFYNEIDVFLSCSYIEGCPLPPQEAMWCGCPVVATPIGIQGEYDLHGEDKTCELVEPGDASGTARAVVGLLKEHQAWAALRENALQAIRQRTTGQMGADFALALARAIDS